MPRLFALSGVDLGRSFEVRSGAAIGRGADCEIVLRDASISRKHAHVAEVGGVWSVIDDASRNGLWSAGKRVRSRIATMTFLGARDSSVAKFSVVDGASCLALSTLLLSLGFALSASVSVILRDVKRVEVVLLVAVAVVGLILHLLHRLGRRAWQRTATSERPS